MLQKLNKYIFLACAILLIVTAAFIEYRLLQKHPEKHLVEDFQVKLNLNEGELVNLMETVKSKISSKNFKGNIWESFNNLLPEIDDCGKAIMVYKYENLEYWSDRAISFFDKLDNYETHNGIIQLRNGYYLITSLKVNEYNIIGLVLIKRNYIYENKYLQNDFYKDYRLPADFRLLQYETENSFPVKNLKQDLLFYLKPAGDYLCSKDQMYLPAILYFTALIFLLYYFKREFADSKIQFEMKLLRLLAALVILYFIHLVFKIPKVLFFLKLFSPDDFAMNNLLPSLGDLFFLSLFFLFWIYCFISELSLKSLEEESKMSQRFIVIILLVFCAGIYLFANLFIEKLVFDSTISFNLNRITSITTQSVLGLFSVGLFLAGIVFLTLKISIESKNVFSFAALSGITLVIAVIIAAVQFLVKGKPDFTILALFTVSTILASLYSKGYLRNYMLSYLIVFVSAASLYSIIIFYYNISHKERDLQKQRAVTLVTERDPAAEVFLGDIQNQIVVDSKIPDFIVHDNRDLLPDYLEQTYFNGYFRKYDTRIYICSVSDTLNILDEDIKLPCIPFFEEKFSSNGIRITATNFYFMDNMNGRISYAGKIYYPFSSDSSGIYIFVEMDSELLFEGIGFPELLIDKTISKPAYYSKFSYAKYYGGELTDKSGDYNYNTYVDSYVSDTTEFQIKKRDGLEHLIYNTRQNNYIIVSRKAFTFIDYLISFPYLFVFYFVIALFLLFMYNHKLFKWKNVVDLKFKIQMSIVAIVFISLLVVALATLYYNVEEYRSKHKNDLDEKLKSISEEIDMAFEDKQEISTDMVDWLNKELLKLSNIFRTDINIYDPLGRKISSSRSEIFNRGLVSDRINSRAKFEVDQNLSAWFQPEKIGQMSYLSAYQPIVNKWGDVVGIINLPYFVKQDGYSQEISTFIVAFINLYVLLLLASIIMAVFIANQITKPLVDIQNNLKKMELGKPNEPISYKRNDEIGSLVKEYNKKVEELAISAELLARSERESAWREMAKQIAHEIKNPLTPMKLNIQYLQKAKKDTKEYQALIEKVSVTLIEQIDNLSNIATEFSNFAKIPTARNQVFNLAEQLQKVIDLYETNEQSIIVFKTNGFEDIHVNADREQLGRAVINLIKNGIQAIPEGQPGIITVSIDKKDEKAIISVTDNGSGIPEELREKLFSPSFTTKTSGMGLGLAIVKNIVENFYGNVWFETQLDKGTTFFVEIPVFEKSLSNN